MAALDRVANRAHTRLTLAPFGGMQAETGPLRPRLRWLIPVGPICLRPW